MKRILLLLCLFFVNDSYALVTGDKAPSFKAKTASGEEITLGNFRGKVIVLEWLNHGCPFIKKHYKSGNMQKLQKRFTQDGVVWLSVISSAKGKQGYSNADKAKEDKKRLGSLATHIILDESGDLGRKFGAKTTPHMFVINQKGELVYQGAIDSIASADPGDIGRAKNYVVLALKKILKGTDVEIGKTRPYGCSVKY